MSSTVLEVRDLRVQYGSVVAVDGLSLDVAEGEVVGIIGANGAGKTSTLGAITGLVPATGRVALDGRSIVGRATEQIASDGVALVPEGRHIFGTLSVEENLSLGLTVRGGTRRGRAELAEAFDRFPVLERYAGSSAAHLSGGEQQQLAIARALLARPRLLILDEPSLGLAPLIVDEVFAVLDRLRSEGSTVLLVEQNAARTVAFADRTYLLNGGRVAHVGDRESFAREVDVAAAYLGIREAS